MLWRLAVLTTAAHALAPKRYRLRPRNAVDPIRPEIGSPAPLVINALVAMERGASARAADAPDVAIEVQEMRPKLQEVLVSTCADEPWIAKYKEEGRFGLPLDSKDPLVTMQRNECLLALYLLARHPDGVSVDDGAPLLKAEDFLDQDRLDVVMAGALDLDL
jgi:hypothetical protein